MTHVGVAPSCAYNVLRELGRRAQPTFAAMRDVIGAPSDLVVLTRFVLSSLPQATGPGVVNERALARIERAAHAARATFHPNVARVRHVDLDPEHGDTLSIGTDLVDGATLEDLLRERPIALDVQLRILLDVLSGLSALHALRDVDGPIGAFHGELCPANVVVGRDGIARIVDVFRPTPVRIRAGSEALFHASPEALDIDGARSARADLYAVGNMLWEAIAQRTLHHGAPDPAELLTALRSANAQRPDDPEDEPWVRGLADVALKALAFDPNLRYRTATEMATAMRAVAGGVIAQGSAVAAHVQTTAGDAIRARRAAFDPLASGAHKRTSGVRRSLELDDGGVVTLVPDVVSEEVAGLDAIRIADSSLMPPASPSSSPSAAAVTVQSGILRHREHEPPVDPNAPATKPRLPAPTVEADIMREMLELHGLETSTEPGAEGPPREGPSARLRPFPKAPIAMPASIPRGVPTLDFPTIVAAEAVRTPMPMVPPLPTPMPASVAPPLPPAAARPSRTMPLVILAVAGAVLFAIIVAGAIAAWSIQASRERARAAPTAPAPSPARVDQRVVAPTEK